ncbi:MAG: hypothetical protein IKT99_03660 [Oscillospiraceae bacterium]|nr:hypothetical protein [Oscillospiraceae bacterium]
MEKFRLFCHKTDIFIPIFWKSMENPGFSNGRPPSIGPDAEPAMPAGQGTETAGLCRRAYAGVVFTS